MARKIKILQQQRGGRTPAQERCRRRRENGSEASEAEAEEAGERERAMEAEEVAQAWVRSRLAAVVEHLPPRHMETRQSAAGSASRDRDAALRLWRLSLDFLAGARCVVCGGESGHGGDGVLRCAVHFVQEFSVGTEEVVGCGFVAHRGCAGVDDGKDYFCATCEAVARKADKAEGGDVTMEQWAERRGSAAAEAARRALDAGAAPAAVVAAGARPGSAGVPQSSPGVPSQASQSSSGGPSQAERRQSDHSWTSIGHPGAVTRRDVAGASRLRYQQPPRGGGEPQG